MSVSASESANATGAAGAAGATGAAGSAARAAGRDAASPAPSTGGAQPLFGVPGRFIVHDIARDGRMLAVREDLIFGVRVSVPGATSQPSPALGPAAQSVSGGRDLKAPRQANGSDEGTRPGQGSGGERDLSWLVARLGGRAGALP
jgi:hypothetical protein